MPGEFVPIRVNYPINSDKTTETLDTITYEHHEIHEGNSFHAHFYSGTVDTDGTVELLISTPNTTKWIHALGIINSTKGALVEIYEGPTTSADGTTVTAYNRNRNSNEGAVVVITDTPTISNDGTRLWLRHIGSEGKYTEYGETRGNNEWILRQNTKYLFRATSHEDANELMVGLNWYEHTNLH